MTNAKSRMQKLSERSEVSDPSLRPCGIIRSHPSGSWVSRRGFTLVEIVISLTIIIIIAAGAVPMFKGLREEQLAREPIIELVRLAKEARIRAMREKRPYQVAFYPGGFMASRYFSPYFQLTELTTFLQEGESGVYRLNPNADEDGSDLDGGSDKAPQTAETMAQIVNDNWEEHYNLPQDAQYSIKYWHDMEETFIEGEVVKLWVFQPSGICQPLKLHLERPSAMFDVEFGALTADITREVIELR
jgi:prepilin-type N-terminal cleavage/methylation domain-containing protein